MLWLLLAACGPGGGLPNVDLSTGPNAIAISHRGHLVTHVNQDAGGNLDAQIAVSITPAVGGVGSIAASVLGRSERDLRFDRAGRVMMSSGARFVVLDPSGTRWLETDLPAPSVSAPADVELGWVVGHADGLSLVGPTGALVWTTPIDGTVRGHLAVGSDESIFAIVDDDDAWSAIRVSVDGELLWQTPLPSVTTTPALASDNTLLVTVLSGSLLDAAAGQGHELYALESSTGEQRFTTTIDAQPFPPLVTADDEVLMLGNISTDVAQLLQCNASTGRVSSRAQFDGPTTGGTLDQRGQLWHGCPEGVCVRSSSGRLLGTFESTEPLIHAPALYDNLMVANASGRIQTWWLDDGTEAANDGWSRMGGDGPGTGRGWGR